MKTLLIALFMVSAFISAARPTSYVVPDVLALIAHTSNDDVSQGVLLTGDHSMMFVPVPNSDFSTTRVVFATAIDEESDWVVWTIPYDHIDAWSLIGIRNVDVQHYFEKLEIALTRTDNLNHIIRVPPVPTGYKDNPEANYHAQPPALQISHELPNFFIHAIRNYHAWFGSYIKVVADSDPNLNIHLRLFSTNRICVSTTVMMPLSKQPGKDGLTFVIPGRIQLERERLTMRELRELADIPFS